MLVEISQAPDSLLIVTPLWEETMLKAWQHYLGLCLLGFREQNF